MRKRTKLETSYDKGKTPLGYNKSSNLLLQNRFTKIIRNNKLLFQEPHTQTHGSHENKATDFLYWLACPTWLFVIVNTDLDILLCFKVTPVCCAEPKLVKKDQKAVFQLIQKRTMGDATFNQFTRLRNQLIVPPENLNREENLSLCRYQQGRRMGFSN